MDLFIRTTAGRQRVQNWMRIARNWWGQDSSQDPLLFSVHYKIAIQFHLKRKAEAGIILLKMYF